MAENETAHQTASFFKDKKIIITGLTGFIGSRLAKELLEKDALVYAFCHKGSQNLWRVQNILEKVAWIKADLCDYQAVCDSLRTIDPDIIYHLATYYSVDNKVDFSAIIDTNIKASVTLLRSCEGLRKLKLFVNVGTCAEYGDLRKKADEKTPLNPNSIYASTKAANTIILHQLASDFGIPLTTLRLYNLYGEFEKPERLVPYVILTLLNNQTVELTGCKQQKDYSYLGDFVNAFLKAAENHENAKGEIFNIGSGKTIKLKELVMEIVKQLEADYNKVKFGSLQYRENEMWYQGTSIKKAKKCLKWEPQVSLEEGIKRTVGWYKDNLELYNFRQKRCDDG